MSFHALIAHLFLALNNIPLLLCHLDVPQFIHLPPEGHLSCAQVLAVRNGVAIYPHAGFCVDMFSSDSVLYPHSSSERNDKIL